MVTTDELPTRIPRAPRRRRSIGSALRRVTLKAHKWVGLVIATWVVLEVVSGCLLVFADQLDAWSHPSLFHHSAGDVGAQAASAAASSAVASSSVAGVQMPVNESGVYVVTVSLHRAGAVRVAGLLPQRLVYVDPGSGRVNGVRDPNAGFTHWLVRFHSSLLQTKVFGLKGIQLVGWLGVVAILVILSGAYLWLWPAVRKLSTLFRMRRGSVMVLATDLHRLVGIVVFPLIVLTMVTGVNIAFQKEIRQVWYAVTPGPDRGARAAVVAPQSGAHGAATQRVSIDAVRTAAAEATGGRVDSVSVPFSAKGSFAAKVTRGWDPASGPRGRGGNLTVYVDQYSGHVLRVVTPSDYPAAAQLYEYWAVPAHTGTTGGTGTRLLLDGTGIGTLAMVASGIWLTVVRRRKRTKRRTALASALPALPAPVLEDVASQSWIETVPAGRLVVHQGDPADAYYVILAGDFDVIEEIAGVRTTLRTLHAGDSFGQIGLLLTGVRTADVIAATDGELVVVPTEEFQIILDRAERDGLSLSDAGLDYSEETLHRTPAP